MTRGGRQNVRPFFLPVSVSMAGERVRKIPVKVVVLSLPRFAGADYPHAGEDTDGGENLFPCQAVHTCADADDHCHDWL